MEDQIKSAKGGMEAFEKIVDAMTDEERLEPELFFDEESAPERMSRIAGETGINTEAIRRFIAYFSTTRATSASLAKGEKAGDMETDFNKALEKVPGGPLAYGQNA